MPPVELADRHQVEGGDQQPEPRGEAELPDHEGLAVGDRPVDEARDPLEGEGLSEEEPARVGGERLDGGPADAEPEHGQAHEEAGERSRDADVEEGAAVRDGPRMRMKAPKVPTMLRGCQKAQPRAGNQGDGMKWGSVASTR